VGATEISLRIAASEKKIKKKKLFLSGKAID